MICLDKSSGVLFEGSVDTRECWKDNLCLSNDEFQYLVSRSILRKISGSDAESFRLDFVGLISSRNAAFFALPKIFKDKKTDTTQGINLTLSCLQRYERRDVRQLKSAQAGVGDFFGEAGTIVDMFLSLVEWTQEHGFHQSEEKYRNDEFCNISWHDTIRNRYPIHFGHSVLYGDPIGYRHIPTHNELAHLQSLALLELSHHLGIISQIWLPNHDPLRLSALEIISDSDLVSRDRLEMRRIIDDLSFSSNRDTDKDLLDILSRWLDLDYKVSTKIQFYGTNAFHAVWEKICGFIFNGLGTPQPHSILASQPAYVTPLSSISISSQRPDILIEVGNNLQIADAKWYDLDSGDIPHLEDVIKQFVYQMSLAPHRHVQNNLFLMPGINGAPWCHMGRIEMCTDQGRDPRFPNIDIIRLDWFEAASSYANLTPPNWGEALLKSISSQ